MLVLNVFNIIPTLSEFLITGLDQRAVLEFTKVIFTLDFTQLFQII